MDPLLLCAKSESGSCWGHQGAQPRMASALAPECLLADAAERSRTSTALAGHKALNLARLPIPPPAQGDLDCSGARAGPERPARRPVTPA